VEKSEEVSESEWEVLPPEIKVRFLAEVYLDYQQIRVAANNKLMHYQRKYGKEAVLQELGWFTDVANMMEDRIVRELTELLEEFPIYTEWLKYVKGVGPALAGQIIGLLYTEDGRGIERFSNVSKLWKYCALDVVDGRAPRPEKGRHYGRKKKLKGVLWKIAVQMLKAGRLAEKRGKPIPKGYQYYLEFKRKEEAKNKPFRLPVDEAAGKELAEDIGSIRAGTLIKKRGTRTVGRTSVTITRLKRELRKVGRPEDDMILVRLAPSHIHNRALRKLMKLFLALLWEKWRTLEGLPVRPPYAKAILGHDDLLSPEDLID